MKNVKPRKGDSVDVVGVVRLVVEIKTFVQDLVKMGVAKAEILNRRQERYGAGVLIKKQA